MAILCINTVVICSGRTVLVLDLVLYVRLGLLYVFVVVSPGCDFVFEIDWEERLQNDLLCVGWTLNLKSINQRR